MYIIDCILYAYFCPKNKVGQDFTFPSNTVVKIDVENE